ncbi:MAG: hypothetical protein ABFE07_28190 [Armatimonadia bacterium]
MKKNLKEQLIRDFPGMLRTESKLFSISVGDGWFKLVYLACAQLEKLGGVQIKDIKEKFGALDILLEGPEKARDIAHEAWQQSQAVCEWCGQPGGECNDYWIKTLCAEHRVAFARGENWWTNPDGTRKED